MNRFIVIVEDDHLQEGPLEEQIRDAFPQARIDTVGSEQEFRDRLAGYRRNRPDVIVMDVMLRWAYPRPNPTVPPPEVVRGGYQRAGFRCAQLVAEDAALSGVPIIYYTILERSDLERSDPVRDTAQPPDDRNTTYVRKSTDPEVLIRKIRQLIRKG